MLAGFPAFTVATAKATGISRRSVQRMTQMASALSPQARDLLRTSKIASNGAQLLALAELETDQQLAVAREISEGRATSVTAAKLSAGLTPRRNIDESEVAFQRFLGIWGRAGRPLRARIRAHIKASAADEAGAQ